MTGTNWRCPTCGAPVPQHGGDLDRDLREAHHKGEHGEPTPKPDNTYSGVLVLAVAVLLAVLFVVLLA